MSFKPRYIMSKEKLQYAKEQNIDRAIKEIIDSEGIKMLLGKDAEYALFQKIKQLLAIQEQFLEQKLEARIDEENVLFAVEKFTNKPYSAMMEVLYDLERQALNYQKPIGLKNSLGFQVEI